MKHPISLSSVLLLRCLLLLFLAPLIQYDVQDLADIMAKITLSNATDTLSYIRKLVNQTEDPKLEQSLAYCAEVYIPVVQYILPQAIDALNKGGYGFAKYGMLDAADEVDSCTRSKKSPLAGRKQLVLDLCGVTVAIINILLKK